MVSMIEFEYLLFPAQFPAMPSNLLIHVCLTRERNPISRLTFAGYLEINQGSFFLCEDDRVAHLELINALEQPAY